MLTETGRRVHFLGAEQISAQSLGTTQLIEANPHEPTRS